MKKFLLSIALLAAGATVMNAASFEVKVHGKDGEVVENGATITHNTVEVNDPDLWLFEMDPHIVIANNDATTKQFDVTVKAISMAVNEGAEAQAFLGFCIGSCVNISTDGQEASLPLTVEAGKTSADAQPAPHIVYTPGYTTNYDTWINTYLTGKSEFQFTVSSGNESITFNIIFDYVAENNAVDGVETDNNATPEYFNMQGVRVANPDKGIYIVRRGNKITKEIVK